MSIRYQIVANPFAPGAYVARVVPRRRVGLEALIASIAQRTSLGPTDMRAAVALLIEEVQLVLMAGDTAVIDGLATFSVSLSGSFTTPDTIIARESAQLNLAVQGDVRLRASVAASASYTRLVRNTKAPILGSAYDVATARFNHYTPGSVVRLLGDHLKFDPAQADEGVFLCSGGAETRMTIYSAIGRRRLDVLVPATVSGEQQVVVRTRYTSHGELREGRFAETLHQAS
jgi:hypothetical protein